MKHWATSFLYWLLGFIPYTVVGGRAVWRYPKLHAFIVELIMKIDPDFTDGG